MATRVVPLGSPSKRRQAAQHLAIDLEQLEDDPPEAVRAVLCLLDGWQGAEAADIDVQQLSGAMTNLVFRVAYKQQVVLLRVHASKSDLFERSEEIATFQAVSQSGIGPQLLLLFANGRVEEFLGEHVTLGAGDLRDPEVSAAIAAATAEFHHLLTEQLASSPLHCGPMLIWERLRQWLGMCEGLWGLNGARIDANSNSSTGMEDGHIAGSSSRTEDGQVAGNSSSGEGDGAAGAEGAGAAGAAGLADAAGMADAAGPEQAAEAAGMADAAGAEHAAEVAAALVQLRRELPALEELLMAKYPVWVAMCHNDLQYGNIMVKAPPAALLSNTSATAAAAAAAAPNATAPAEPADALAGALHNKLHLQPLQPHALPADAHGGSLQEQLADAATGQHSARSDTSHTDFTLKHHSSSGLRELGAPSDASRSGTSRSGSRRLPDGSFVLPGLESRPRGQSPVRNPYERALGASSFGSTSFGSTGAGGASTGSAGGSRGRQQQQQTGAAADAAVAAEAADAAAAAGGEAAEAASAHQAAALLGAGTAAAPAAAAAPAVAAAPAAAAAAPATAATRLRRCIPSAGDLTSFGSGDFSGQQPTRAPATAAADTDWGFDLSLPSPQPSAVAVQDGAVDGHAGRGGDDGDDDGSSSGLSADADVASDADGAPHAAQAHAGGQQRRSSSGNHAAETRQDINFPVFEGSDDEDEAHTAAASQAGHDHDHSQQQDARSRLSRLSASAAAASQAAAADGAADGPEVEAGADGTSAELASSGHRAASHGSESMRLIDYEYSGFNPIAFDIANHWSEWAADYHGPEPAAMDYSRMPNKAQQRCFIQDYLNALLRCAGVEGPGVDGASTDGSVRPEGAGSGAADGGAGCDGCAGADANGSSGEEVAKAAGVAASAASSRARATEMRSMWQWLEQYEPGVTQSKRLSSSAWQRAVAALHEASLGMVCLSAAQWALWGWVQVRSSDVDYDFAQYARHRWAQYLDTRPAELQQPPALA